MDRCCRDEASQSTDLRRRWRGLLGLALLIGVTGGVVLTAAEGGRRTQTAYPRMLAAAHAADMLVSPPHTGFGGFYRALQRLPQVKRMGVGAGVVLGYAEMLAEYPGLPKDMSELVNEIVSGAKELAETVDQLRRVTRIRETPRPSLTGPTLDLHESVA